MMIEREWDGFTLTCDICGHEIKPFDSFQEAVQYKKDEGWRSQKRDGEWEDICPDCQD